MFAASWRHVSERGNVGSSGYRVETWWTLKDASKRGNVGSYGYRVA